MNRFGSDVDVLDGLSIDLLDLITYAGFVSLVNIILRVEFGMTAYGTVAAVFHLGSQRLQSCATHCFLDTNDKKDEKGKPFS